MFGLDPGDHLEEDRSLLVPLLLGRGGKVGVHRGVLVVLSGDGFLEIGVGVADATEERELVLGVSHFVDCG